MKQLLIILAALVLSQTLSAQCPNDIDCDGTPDICDVDVTPGSDCNGNGILDSCDIQGDGTFNNSFQQSGGYFGDTNPSSITFGDVDADGDLDLVIGNHYWGPNRVFMNDGYGDFTDSGQELQPAYHNDYTRAIALGDIDADGDLDMVVATISQPSQPYLYQ